jgi:hypothetical protein
LKIISVNLFMESVTHAAATRFVKQIITPIPATTTEHTQIPVAEVAARLVEDQTQTHVRRRNIIIVHGEHSHHNAQILRGLKIRIPVTQILLTRIQIPEHKVSQPGVTRTTQTTTAIIRETAGVNPVNVRTVLTHHQEARAVMVDQEAVVHPVVAVEEAVVADHAHEAEAVIKIS